MEIVHTAEFESPVGALRVASSERGLCYVGLPREAGRGFEGWLVRHAPGAKRVAAWAPNQQAVAQLVEFLEGKRRVFDLELDVRGTPFQRAVWEALLAIPYGETRAYAEIARAVGRPAAVRAVGTANGANPLPLVIPCHRVVETGGHLGGYGGGLPLKRRLLAMERSGELL
jgi:methylated-DNA-[protein]-cysteine S-methyltransferase